ncbi:hypothetical protein DNTS_008253, partial [Danionella cerebrum]
PSEGDKTLNVSRENLSKKSVQLQIPDQCSATIAGVHVISLFTRVNLGSYHHIVFFCTLIFLHLCLVQGARQEIKCGACRAIVDEMEWAISQTDPKKTIQTGSFRINPDGSQSMREVPFARSEGHLLELMEEVCENMKEYGERVDPETDRKTYVRHTSREGANLDVSDVALDSRVSSSLKFACETIIEQHEDELIEFFAHETENVKDKLCSKRTDLCDHALEIPHDEL